jgi:hypothetical protein
VATATAPASELAVRYTIEKKKKRITITKTADLDKSLNRKFKQ